jgi:hypothetical protein
MRDLMTEMICREEAVVNGPPDRGNKRRSKSIMSSTQEEGRKYAAKAMAWYGWGSAVGLGLFLVGLGTFLVLLRLAALGV